MPLTTNAVQIEKTDLSWPFRIILSGSSGSGKTYFAEKLLESQQFDIVAEYLYYFYPCYMGEPPVTWHETMDIPVSYQTGLPTLEQMMNMPQNSVIVLDDLMGKCIINEDIDQLFRVISGKRNISVMIMSQNYFAQGRYGRNIRNSCNYHVLLRNCCDATINRRAVIAMGLTKAFDLAVTDCCDIEYPYIFIDQTAKGRSSGYQVYTNIFDRYQKVYSNRGMPSYIIPEKDFLSVFKILQAKNRIILAQEKNENKINETAKSSTEAEGKTQKESVDCSSDKKLTKAVSSKGSVGQPKPYSRGQRKRARRFN